MSEDNERGINPEVVQQEQWSAWMRMVEAISLHEINQHPELALSAPDVEVANQILEILKRALDVRDWNLAKAIDGLGPYSEIASKFSKHIAQSVRADVIQILQTHWLAETQSFPRDAYYFRHFGQILGSIVGQEGFQPGPWRDLFVAHPDEVRRLPDDRMGGSARGSLHRGYQIYLEKLLFNAELDTLIPDKAVDQQIGENIFRYIRLPKDEQLVAAERLELQKAAFADYCHFFDFEEELKFGDVKPVMKAWYELFQSGTLDERIDYLKKV